MNSFGFARLQICHSWCAYMNRECFYDFKIDKNFVSMTPRPAAIRKNINRSDYLKIALKTKC